LVVYQVGGGRIVRKRRRALNDLEGERSILEKQGGTNDMYRKGKEGLEGIGGIENDLPDTPQAIEALDALHHVENTRTKNTKGCVGEFLGGDLEDEMMVGTAERGKIVMPLGMVGRKEGWNRREQKRFGGVEGCEGIKKGMAVKDRLVHIKKECGHVYWLGRVGVGSGQMRVGWV
jgi:hypothetical protein